MVPIRQSTRVGLYLLRQKLARRDKFPLVLELEPLFACNLACAGCGKIQHPTEVLRQRVSVEDAVAAVEECGAPIVSIAGGEPLLHPDIVEMVEALIRRRRFVYLCTNAVLLRRQFEESLAELTGFFGEGAGRGMFSYTNPRYHHIVKFSRSFDKPEEIRMQMMNLQLLMNEDQAATFLFHPWLTFYVMNAAKFTNFIGVDGLPKPFEEWVIRRRP